MGVGRGRRAVTGGGVMHEQWQTGVSHQRGEGVRTERLARHPSQPAPGTPSELLWELLPGQVHFPPCHCFKVIPLRVFSAGPKIGRAHV